MLEQVWRVVTQHGLRQSTENVPATGGQGATIAGRTLLNLLARLPRMRFGEDRLVCAVLGLPEPSGQTYADDGTWSAELPQPRLNRMLDSQRGDQDNALRMALELSS
jgi:hypothetical protein